MPRYDVTLVDQAGESHSLGGECVFAGDVEAVFWAALRWARGRGLTPETITVRPHAGISEDRAPAIATALSCPIDDLPGLEAGQEFSDQLDGFRSWRIGLHLRRQQMLARRRGDAM